MRLAENTNDLAEGVLSEGEPPVCIAILTDLPFIPTHRYLMNHADEYYVKGVYLGVVCCCFFLLLQVLSYIISTLSFLP